MIFIKIIGKHKFMDKLVHLLMHIILELILILLMALFLKFKDLSFITNIKIVKILSYPNLNIGEIIV